MGRRQNKRRFIKRIHLLDVNGVARMTLELDNNQRLKKPPPIMKWLPPNFGTEPEIRAVEEKEPQPTISESPSMSESLNETVIELETANDISMHCNILMSPSFWNYSWDFENIPEGGAEIWPFI